MPATVPVYSKIFKLFDRLLINGGDAVAVVDCLCLIYDAFVLVRCYSH